MPRISASWRHGCTRRPRTTPPRAAILFGFSPKFGALVASVPGGVLGGITVVLYGMIGLLGAKIWKENQVDFSNPINLIPVAAGIIIAIGNTKLVFSDSFSPRGHRAPAPS